MNEEILADIRNKLTVPQIPTPIKIGSRAKVRARCIEKLSVLTEYRS